MLDVTERTVRRAIARGELVAVRRGVSYRIDRDELARYAARFEQSAGPRPLARVVPFPDPEDGFASAPGATLALCRP